MKSPHLAVAVSCNSSLPTGPARTTLAGIDYYGETQPAAETSWDYFDFLPLDRQNLVCSIGKATGSGIAARFTLASLQAFLRSLTLHHRGAIGAIVHDLNGAVCEISPNGFYASLFYAWIDSARGQLHYVSAGHSPALLVRREGGRVQRLEKTGTVLGLSRRVGFHRRTVDLENGDLLLASSDGVNDCLSESALIRAAARSPQPRPADLVREILDAARPTADRTALAIRFQRAGEEHAAHTAAAELAFSAA